MRLINVSTYEIEEFFGEEIPNYAILSHTWIGGEEVTFQEFSDQKEKAKNGARTKSGWDKIENTARLAWEDKHEHVWIDTCCIDKTSSAELTEAINSMMSWYEKSQVCYTYLRDVPSRPPRKEQEDAFRDSRWFTRGWTLQELLAPSKLIFIFADWMRFDTRDKMADLVSSISGIDASFLCTPEAQERTSDNSAIRVSRRAKLESASIAQRMSWASKRRTSRVEDIAYCLLGIFDINMPLLYGEGPKAFLRLQEQILMSSDDQSILAWNFEGFQTEYAYENGENWWSDYDRELEYAGLFATSPAAFSTCKNIKRTHIGKPALHSLITNRGLRLELRLGPSVDFPYAFLQCHDKDAPVDVVALPLTPTPEGFYVRARLPLRLVDYRFLRKSPPTELYALKYGNYAMRRKTGKEYTVIIRNLPKEIKILDSCCESGNMGPYSQVIIDNDGRNDRMLGGALLLGDHSDNPKFGLVVVSRSNGNNGAPQAMYGLIEPSMFSGYPSLERHFSRCRHFIKLWNPGWDPHFSTHLMKILKKSRTTIRTADGVYSASAIVPDSFGKSLIIIDVSIGSRRFDCIMSPSWQSPLWFRIHMQGHDGIKELMLLLVLAPRAFAIVVEFLAREIAIHPWYMVPFMADYVFLTTSDPPRFLASVLARARRESLQTLKTRAVISLLTYLSCKLIGSDTVLERFKKLLATKQSKDDGETDDNGDDGNDGDNGDGRGDKEIEDNKEDKEITHQELNPDGRTPDEMSHFENLWLVSVRTPVASQSFSAGHVK
ncbi:het domain-containing protein [Colletotrichum camelliae]|nr:het domain-containing protein [Colletotrichum camelliae]